MSPAEALPEGIFFDDEVCSVGGLQEGSWGDSGAASETDVATYLRSSLQDFSIHPRSPPRPDQAGSPARLRRRTTPLGTPARAES